MIRTNRLLLLLFALVLLVPALSGCIPGTPFAQAVPVDLDPAKALAEGAEREKKVAATTFPPSAAEVDKDRVLVPAWTEVATYYSAVAQKYAGTETGLKAMLAQARVLDQGAKHRDQALNIYRNAVGQYPGNQEAISAEQDLIRRMNEENSTKPGYQILDAIVRALGGNPAYSYLLAIVAISVAVTLALWPLRARYYAGMKELQRYMPEMQKIREKYKDDRGLQQEKLMEFSQKHGMTQKQFLGCLPLVMQWPVLWGLWAAINQYQFQFAKATFLWINPATAEAWARISFPPPFNFLNAAIAPSLGQQDFFLLLLYALSMYIQMKMTPVSDPAQAEQQKMMAFMMPSMFFVMMLQWHLPSAFVLYWFLSNILTVAQQWWITKSLPTPPPLVLDGGSDSGGGGTPALATAGTSGSTTSTDGKAMTRNQKLVAPKSRRKK